MRFYFKHTLYSEFYEDYRIEARRHKGYHDCDEVRGEADAGGAAAAVALAHLHAPFP